jgi:hypothetical protein
MGDANRRRALCAEPRGIRPEPPPMVQRHVLALIDRRMTRDEHGEVHFSDHSAKPNTYVSADMKTLYRWDGIRLRHIIDTGDQKSHNRAARVR